MVVGCVIAPSSCTWFNRPVANRQANQYKGPASVQSSSIVPSIQTTPVKYNSNIISSVW